jgi:hypothetical protein
MPQTPVYIKRPGGLDYGTYDTTPAQYSFCEAQAALLPGDTTAATAKDIAACLKFPVSADGPGPGPSGGTQASGPPAQSQQQLDLNQAIIDLQTEISDLTGSLTQAQSEVTDLVARHTAGQTDLVAAQAEVTRLQGELSTVLLNSPSCGLGRIIGNLRSFVSHVQGMEGLLSASRSALTVV